LMLQVAGHASEPNIVRYAARSLGLQR